MQESLKTALFQKLDTYFHPQLLQIEDQSHLHKGHVGVQNAGGETHFKIKLVSPQFRGLSRVERYRLVHEVLGSSLISKIHALTLVLHESV